MELLMPFVIVKTKGGPHDDEAFTSGWRLGTIMAAVEPSGTEWSGIVREDEVPQVELIAMRRGLTVTQAEPSLGWVVISMRHPDGDDPCLPGEFPE